MKVSGTTDLSLTIQRAEELLRDTSARVRGRDPLLEQKIRDSFMALAQQAVTEHRAPTEADLTPIRELVAQLDRRPDLGLLLDTIDALNSLERSLRSEPSLGWEMAAILRGASQVDTLLTRLKANSMWEQIEPSAQAQVQAIEDRMTDLVDALTLDLLSFSRGVDVETRGPAPTVGEMYRECRDTAEVQGLAGLSLPELLDRGATDAEQSGGPAATPVAQALRSARDLLLSVTAERAAGAAVEVERLVQTASAGDSTLREDLAYTNRAHYRSGSTLPASTILATFVLGKLGQALART